jgi:hypothetical protein
MPLRILSLPPQFRPGTSITYPPFKKGRYMEEYVYEYMMEHAPTIESDAVYVPVFWTNLQNHPGFTKMKAGLSILLQRAIDTMPKTTVFFTVVQHDDGPQLPLPKNTIIFGACTGTIPLPLVYEDTSHYLASCPRSTNRPYLASFVGTNTHRIREKMIASVENKANVLLETKPHAQWTNQVPKTAADMFVEATLQSKFCLAPRGYGRGSFRFYEAMLLDTIPVYFWDDQEWLPYKDIIDYTTFTVSIQEKDIEKTYNILESISKETYESMMEHMKRYRNLFTLGGMCEYILLRIKTKPL